MVGLGLVLLLKSFCVFMKIFEMLITKDYITGMCSAGAVCLIL